MRILSAFVILLSVLTLRGGDTLRSVFISAAVQSLNGSADIDGAAAENPFLGQTQLQTIQVAATNASYKSIDGVLFDQSGCTLIAWPTTKQVDIYSIPKEVRYIAAGAFAFASHLEKIIIPDTVESIGEGAFREMENLQEIDLPKNLQNVSPFLFYNCRALSKLSLPDRLIGIGRHALEGCESLADLHLPRQLKHIGSSAFRGCVALKKLLIPAGIQSLGISAFFECRKGLQVTFAGNINWHFFLYGDPSARRG